MNPYESPRRKSGSSTASRRRLDRGVLFIGGVLVGISVISLAGLVLPQLRDFLMPRFGWIGALIGMNALIPIGAWIKNPTRGSLLAASFMLCGVGLINGWGLYNVGTVDVVENVFHDRLHSSWGWSVATYLFASVYVGIAALRDNVASEPAVVPH